MGFKLQVRARDVTLLPETRPAIGPEAAPERIFAIEHDGSGYKLSFDGRRVSTPDDAIRDLLIKVAEGSPNQWQYSSNESIQSTFRPLRRIIQCLNSTPSYQLFLSGFHIGDAIGMFDLEQVEENSIADSFRYLVGALAATRGKKGRLFFIPDGYLPNNEVIEYLMGNGKLFSSDFFTITASGYCHIANKLFVPYATPIGFNTRITPETEVAWSRISDLVRQQSGGYGL